MQRLVSGMDIINWGYESVLQDTRPPNQCRSLWHNFHGAELLYYLEEYLMYEHQVWDIRVIIAGHLTLKLMFVTETYI